jgi:hypothetical protein
MKTVKRGLLSVFFCLFSIASGATPAIDPNLYLDDVKLLASQDLRGRGTGTPELEKAAAFIAGKFREFGLQPVNGKSYYQPFRVTTSAHLGKSNRFRFTGNGHATALRFPEDFIPLNISSAARLSGPVVFAGYGITAPKYHYDDYAGIDVKGKFVLILRHEPQEADDSSAFNGKNYSEYATFASKASNAKMHGAAGIILIFDRANHTGQPDELEKFGSTQGPFDSGIPFVQVKEEQVAGWFKAAGKDLESIQSAIDKDLKPQSFPFPDSLRVTADVDLERVEKTVHNVAGFLPGKSDEYIIIGAHYDHLGLGEQFSMAPSMIGTVHPGADDNASGTAGVVELARWFSKQPKQKRGVLFLTFAGEEMGLLGSSYYVSHPEFPLDKAVAMINMDMIGRMREGKVYIGGAGTGSNLRAILEKDTPKYHLNLDLSDNAGFSGSSDHISFTGKQVPALFFFSGLHGDYHKPSDTWDKIDAPDAARLLALIADVAEDLREAADRPQFVRLAPPAGHGEGIAAGPTGGSSGGYGPYFGSVPDFGEETKGVKFADVREGSPAAKAGLKAGDILVEFDGKPIQNLYDFTYALRERQPGDAVKVKVMRDGKPVEATATLSARQ